jgi:K+-transporting ATPase ATPase C chain
MSISSHTSGAGRQLVVAVRLLAVVTVVIGVLYPLVVWAAGQVIAPGRAGGQLLVADGAKRGSSLIGQEFPIADDQWFHGRPSAEDHDGLASGPSNLGPSNPDLLDSIEQRRAAVAEVEGVAPAAVPPDAVTASASGLDPSISPAYAALQVERVAQARGLPVAEVERLVAEHTAGRQLGFLGQPRVAVLELNLALEGD